MNTSHFAKYILFIVDKGRKETTDIWEIPHDKWEQIKKKSFPVPIF